MKKKDKLLRNKEKLKEPILKKEKLSKNYKKKTRN